MATFNDGHVSFSYPMDWAVHKDSEYGQIFINCSEAIAGSDMTAVRLVVQYAAEAEPDPGDLDLGNDMLKSVMNRVTEEKDMTPFGVIENFSGRSISGLIADTPVAGFTVHARMPTPFEEDFLDIHGVVVLGHYAQVHAPAVKDLVNSLRLT
ncbi:MAG: hypothetical protein ABIL58_10590 [Pseudomonadota bacterium]